MNIEINDFLEIEKQYDLNHLAIDDVYPWTYFRMNFWNYDICKNLLALSEHINQQSNVRLYIKQLKSLLSLFIRRNRKYIHPADLVFLSHERRIKTGDFYECIYTDELTKKYDNSVVLEKPYHGHHLTPVQINNIYYTDMLPIKAELFYLFHRYLKTGKYKRIYREVRNKFSQPLEEIGHAYQYPIRYERIYESLTKIVLQLSWIRSELAKIIDEIQPKVIVETVWYNRICMIINEIAKERGILTVELQHGTMHTAHAAYQFADGCGEIRYFPQYVFVFSEYWKNCARLPICADHIKVTGYPYFERQLNKYKSIKKEERITIIFVSQGTIGKELSRLATDLGELIDETKYHIIYKLHPGEYEGWQSRMPWLLKNNIEVVDSLEHNIYEYFAKCHIQVGVYSTAIYEGLGFGLSTYIYNIGHADTLADLCEQGYASYVNNAEELYMDISAKNLNGHNDSKEFWKMNSFENICSEIDRLLK